ncbi:MAG: tRNA (guanosine(46)-N7)-methyltransferase TrmB [Planctomyces sp.]|nr:tRNA (guanosine(46)-N7)-methyltransferase TrmB [Planctomyces sp.]
MQTAPIKPIKPWFQTIEDIGPHIDWSTYFGQQAPVELDIGCGRGLFLFNAAVMNPQTNFLGIEIDYREGRRTATRLMKRDLPNGRVIGGDCRVILRDMITPHSVSAAHVYFPDPWWKKRHHKRRLFTDEFAALLSQILIPGGLLHSWTDVADYFDIVRSLMDHHPDFEVLAPPEERPAEHDLDYQTSFERKKRKLGCPIYRGLWKRRPLDTQLSPSN